MRVGKKKIDSQGYWHHHEIFAVGNSALKKKIEKEKKTASQKRKKVFFGKFLNKLADNKKMKHAPNNIYQSKPEKTAIA